MVASDRAPDEHDALWALNAGDSETLRRYLENAGQSINIEVFALLHETLAETAETKWRLVPVRRGCDGADAKGTGFLDCLKWWAAVDRAAIDKRREQYHSEFNRPALEPVRSVDIQVKPLALRPLCDALDPKSNSAWRLSFRRRNVSRRRGRPQKHLDKVMRDIAIGLECEQEWWKRRRPTRNSTAKAYDQFIRNHRANERAKAQERHEQELNDRILDYIVQYRSTRPAQAKYGGVPDKASVMVSLEKRMIDTSRLAESLDKAFPESMVRAMEDRVKEYRSSQPLMPKRRRGEPPTAAKQEQFWRGRKRKYKITYSMPSRQKILADNSVKFGKTRRYVDRCWKLVRRILSDIEHEEKSQNATA